MNRSKVFIVTILFILLLGGVLLRWFTVDARNPHSPFFFGTDAKVHLYPGSVVADGEWANVDQALMRDLGEDATYYNFSSEVAAVLIPEENSELLPEQSSSDGDGGTDFPDQSLDSGVVEEGSETPSESGTGNSTTASGGNDGEEPLVEFNPTPQDSGAPTDEQSTSESQSESEETESSEESSSDSQSYLAPLDNPQHAVVFGAFKRSTDLFMLAVDTSLSSITTEAIPSEPVVAEPQPVEESTGVVLPISNESAQTALITGLELEDSLPLPEDTTDTEASSTSVRDADAEFQEIIFKNFASYEMRPGEHVQGVQLRMSLAALPSREVASAPPVIEFYYRTPESVTAIGTLVLSEEVSNAYNGGYQLFGMPTDIAVEELASAEIVVRYYGSLEAVEQLYIDSLWLEVDTKLVTKEDLQNRMKAAAFKELAVPAISTLLSDEVNFEQDELPRFHLRYHAQRNAALRMVREMTGRDLVKVEEAVLIHHGLGRLPVEVEVFTTADGIMTVSIPESERAKLRPGEYTIQLALNEGGKVFVDSFDFQWGLLAWNPNKTEYTPGETANFSIGALTQNGNTICVANLQLFVTTPEGYVEWVPVDVSGKCNGNNVTDTPDFLATYQVRTPGEYSVYLERVGDDGEVVSFMTDGFVVASEAPISIERSGPTRIYPPSTYPMQLTVRTDTGFDGVLTERVPASFTVYDTDAEIDQEGDYYLLTWPLQLNAGGSKTVQYSFNAPDISPYLFTLGPATVAVDTVSTLVVTNNAPEPVVDFAVDSSTSSEAGTAVTETVLAPIASEESLLGFTEHRQWQIASDAVGNMILFWDNNASIPAGWTCLSCGSGTFYQRFAVGSSTYNTTGGATTHTHTATGAVLATAAGAATEAQGTGAISLNSHTHTYSPTIGTASNLPLYRQLRVIQYTTSAGEPATIPAGAIAVFDAAVPTGWTRYSAQDGYYIRGENTAGTTGGANTHTHTITGTTGGAAGGTYRQRGAAPQASGASNAHTHTVSTNTGANSNEPPFITVILGQASSNTVPVNGMISMWTEDVGTGWDDVSSDPADPFSGRFLKASTTYGVTGGAATSTHADVTGVTTSAPSATQNANATPALGGASGAHTHSVNVTGFSVANHLPPYLTVVYGKRLGTEPVFTQLSSRWYANSNVQTPTDPWPTGGADLDEREAISASNRTVNPNEIVRLRLNAQVTNATSSAGAAFKLQYASTAATCEAAVGWADVGSSSAATIWRGYNNTSVTDNSTISSLLLASSTVAVTYNENGYSTSSPNAIGLGAVGEWDFVLQHNGAAAGTVYCFRLVQSDGTVFGSYSHYPQLLTNQTPTAPTLFTYFDNEKSRTLAPTLEFVSTDPENERIDYQVQISTDHAFGSTVVDRNTISNSNDFTNLALISDKPPFISGNTIRFVGTTNLTASTTYWWRVRGKDSDGSNAWGSWSTPQSFTPDPSLTAAAWFQTMAAQFAGNTLSGVETSGNQVQLISGSSSGTMVSPVITFAAGTAGTAWDSFSWNDTEAVGDIKYQVQYNNGTDWVLIPNADLSGNSTGFDTSPVSLLDLDVNTYTQLRLVANFTNSGGSPSLQDWTVRWGYRVPTPTITSPFANEKVSTTTPTFIFVSTDPQGNDLTYQVQWSTSPLFSASTTRTSGTHGGFVNAQSGGDSDPFNSGETILFTIQSSDALTAGGTYWWRVRAKDTTGDNVYSFWTEARSFTVDAAVTASTWFQTTREQFDSNTLSGTVGVSGGLSVATTSDEMLLVYGEGTTSTPKYREWDGSSWSSEGNALSVNAPLNWSITEAAPTREEYVLATLGTDASVRAQVYKEGAWSNLQTIVTSTGNSAARGFDVAYETLSGDAMIVSCNNAVNPVYYTWNGSSWTSGGAITMNYTGNCEWLQLAADPTSDEIVLLVRNAAGSAYEAQVWNGSSWGNSTTIGSIANAVSEGMAVVYEASGDQAIVITSDGNPNRFRWTAWNGTAWSGGATVATGGRVQWAEMVRNVGNDNVALCYVDHNNIIGAVRWTGAAWTGQTNLDTAANTTASRPVSCAFETTSGRANYIIAAYSDGTNARYQVWNGSAWSAEASISTVTAAPVVQLRRAGDGKILGTFFNATNDRYDFSYWNGSSWSSPSTLESDASVASAPYKEPFMMAARNPGSDGTVIVAPPVVFSEGTGPYFETFSWNDATPGSSDVVYQLQYLTASNTWAFIPNSVLPGNETGTTTGSIDLSGLNVATYGTIRPFATLSCDGSNNCPTILDWTITWAEGIAVSGSLREYDQSTNVTSGTVGVAINGAVQIGKTGNVSGGNWTIDNVTVLPGDIVTVFVSGAAAPDEAIGVTRYDGSGDITGIELYERHLSLGSNDATTTPITNSNIGQYDFTNTEDIFANVTSDTLVVCADSGCEDAKLYVRSNTIYQPGGRIVTHDFDNRGTFVAGSFTHEVNGSWRNTGTTTMTGSTVVFAATSTTESINSTGAVSATFNNISLGTTTGSATWTLGSVLDVGGNLIVSRGTFSRGTTSITVGGTLSTEANGFWTGIGTTTFSGVTAGNWRDLNSALQNVGNVVVDGTGKVVTLTGNVFANNVLIGNDDTLDVSTSNYTISVAADWLNQNSFVARQGTVIFVSTTTNRTINTGASAFYNLSFTGGGGSWSFAQNSLTVSNNFTVATGTVTLPTATTTVAGSWNTASGTFAHNNGVVRFTATTPRTITMGGGQFTNAFYDLRFDGGGSWSFTDAATSSRNLTITNGVVTYPSTRLAIGGSLSVTGGSFAGNGGTVDFYGSGTHTIGTNGSTFANLRFSGSGAWSFVPTTVTTSGDLSVVSGTLTLPSATTTIGGSYTNTGSVNANNGSVVFNAATSGKTVAAGSSPFHTLVFNSAGGGWTLTQSATATGAVLLTAANDWTLNSGLTLSAGTSFINNVGGASTTWTGATLSLESGAYQINAKTTVGDSYGTLRVRNGAQITMWNSSATTYDTQSAASIYSQDHAAADGALYIFGAYSRNGGSEYWRRDRDFDGVMLTSGEERAVSVRFAANASATFVNTVLEVAGSSTASTTIANQGSGTYTVSLTNGTTTMQHFEFANLGTTGITLAGSTTVQALDDGYFRPAVGGGAGLTVSAATIDTNPGKQLFRIGFATTTAIAANNVAQTGGTPASYWWFRNGMGNLYGEAYDNDTGDPGSIRFDDSSLVITVAGTVYSDAGSTPLVGGTCNGVATVVRLVVDGGTTYSAPCSNVDGSFSIPNVVVIGDPTLTLYLDGASGGQRAAVVTRTPTANISDLHLYANRLIVRNEDVAALTLSELARFDGDNDSDIPFVAATTSAGLTTSPGTELYVWPGATFAPEGNVTLKGNAQSNSYDGTLVIADGATFTAFATSTLELAGRFVVGSSSVFSAASSTVVMNATTTGKSINGSSTIAFNELVFSGVGGTWNLSTNITVAGDMLVNAGIVTGTNNLTVSGDLIGNGTLSLGSGTTTLALGGTFGGTTPWTFHNLALGNGTVTGTTTALFATTTTITGQLFIANAHFLDAGATTWDLAGTGTVFAGTGTFNYDTSTIRYSGAGANIASRNYYNLDVQAAIGTPTYTATGLGVLVNNNLTIGGAAASTLTLDASDVPMSVLGDLLIRNNGTLVGSNSASLTVSGDWTNLGTFTASGGTVTFNGAGNTVVNAGASPFASVVVNSSGNVTLTAHATATAAFTLLNHTSFTVASGQVLAVGGVFTNSLGGAATTWTDSTLRLYGGGNYTVNASTTSDVYGTLAVSGTTQVRLWNSNAAAYAVEATASLYSQDHAGVDGDLYVYGSYLRSSGSDYWSYATDFDGTALSGGDERAVAVYLANGAKVTVTGGSLEVLGGATATTTLQNQGSGSYGLLITGTASTTWSYYSVRNANSSGLTLSGTPSVSSLSFGDIAVSQNGGSGITVGGTVITANPAKTFTNNRFALDGVGSAFNVTATGTSVSSWRFTNHSGDRAGEAYDSDPTGDPGYVVWDDSAALITISGRVYSDEGSTVSGICNGSTNVVTLRVAGLTSYTASCAAGTGIYSISNVAYSPGDSFMVFIDGQSPKAATVSVAPISSIANFDLYENRVIVRHEGTDPLTIDNMAVWDSSDDADIPFTAVSGSPDTLTLPANRKLLVWDSKTFAPGGNVTVAGNGAGQPYDGTLELQTGAMFSAGAAYTHTIGGSIITGTNATWNAGTSEVVLTTTGSGRTVDTNSAAFYKLTLNGSGSWSVTDTTFTAQDDVTITAGSITLPSATSTFGASFVNNGGSFTILGPAVFTSTSAGESVRFGGSSFATLRFTGSGSWTISDTNATTTGSVIKTAGTLTLPSGQFAIGGSFLNQGGTLTHNTSELILTSTTTAVLQASSSDLYAVTFSGGGVYSLGDTDLTLLNSLTITNGSLTLASGTLSVGGSFMATGGTFAHASGTVLFNGATAGLTINPGSSDFYNVQIGAPSGSYTIAANATTTNNFNLAAADNFTLQSGARLVVEGVFTNTVGGADTTWAGSTLVLSGENAYTINTKITGGDVYGTLLIGPNSAIRAWNSAATVTTVDPSSSFYSQNHNATAGVLNIYGNFVIATTTEYWSYATDFDGTSLSGSERAVLVRHATSATTTMISGTLNIVGSAGNETTITNQGSGTYAFEITGGTINASRYAYRNLNANGLVFSGTPIISSLSYGDFELAVADGTLIALASSSLTANASLVVTGNRFATTTAITGTNVTLVGDTLAAWTFVDHSGNLSGEGYDIDGVTECGSVRWDDSACLLIQQTHYRWRLDDGGEGVPNSEWYDQNWANRQAVRIENDDAETYTNAAIKLTVPYNPGMQNDFGDLVFTDASGTSTVSHFIETYTASTEAVVWVKVPELTGEEVTTVFMYFNNPTANESSTTTVFSFADTFETGNIAAYSGDTSLFTADATLAYERTYGLSNNGDENQRATDGIFRTGNLISQGSTIRFFRYINTTTGTNDEACTLFAVQTPGTNNDNYAVCFEQFGTDRISLVRDVVETEGSGTILDTENFTFATGWYEVEIDWKTDDTITVRVYDDGTQVLLLEATDATYTSGGMGFTYWFNYGGWDLFTARPYMVTVPTIHYGAVQVPDGASWAAAQDTAASGFNTGDTARIRFVVENSGLPVTDKEFELEYAARGAAPSCEAVDSSSYISVPPQSSCGTSPLCMVASTNVVNGEATSDLLFGARGQYLAGAMVEDPSNKTNPIDVGQNQYLELEYVLTPTENVVDQNLCLRVTDEGDELDTYLRVATLQLRFDPAFGAVSLNEGLPIQLVAGTTTAVYATGTVTDLNGFADLAHATATLYRSGTGPGCTPDNNNCYRLSTANNTCSFTNCSGNTCTLSCVADVYFHADPTDAGTYEGQEWLAYVEASDQAGGYQFASAAGVELITLQALTVDTVINYGALEVNSNTGNYNASTSIQNIGNVAIDLSVEGADLSDGYGSVIPADQQKFATSTFTYSACVSCAAVSSSTPTAFELGLPKTMSASTPEEADIYWGIAVPFGANAAPHTGFNTLYAVGIFD